MVGFRTLDPDPVRAKALVDAVRIHPYGDESATTRLVSPEGRPWSGDQPGGLEYWERLHDIYQRETVDERDRFFLAMLKQLGIEKGKPFAPDERLVRILTRASAVGELMAKTNSFAKRFPGARYWPDRQWDLVQMMDRSDQRGDRGSRDDELVYEDDGSVLLHFGPEPPASGETNWVQTVPGRHWFAYTRFYGPLEPYFERSWKLGDITSPDAEVPHGRDAGGVGFS